MGSKEEESSQGMGRIKRGEVLPEIGEKIKGRVTGDEWVREKHQKERSFTRDKGRKSKGELSGIKKNKKINDCY